MRKTKDAVALNTEQNAIADIHTEPEPDITPEPATLVSLLSPTFSTWLIPDRPVLPDTLPACIAEIDGALGALVPSRAARAVIIPQWQRALSSYIQSYRANIAEEMQSGKPLLKTARAQIIRRGNTARKKCVPVLEKVLQAANKEYRLGLVKAYTQWVETFETVSSALELLGDEMVAFLSFPTGHRASRDTEPEPDTEPGYDEPFDGSDDDRKRIALYREGYAQYASGLYGVRKNAKTGKESTYKIIDAIIDVKTRRCVFSVPNRVGQAPEPVGTVQVTEFTGTREPYSKQTVEVHIADMRKREPAFISVIQSIALPHPRKQGDFIYIIGILGQIAPVENRYDATGIIEIDKQRMFLHPASGAITASGFNAAYQVQFNHKQGDTLRRIEYGWQRASTEQQRIADYRTLLQIRDIAPGSTGYGTMLLGIHAFCPMSQLCDTGGVHAIIHGETGSLKSATSRLPLQGYANIYGRSETSTVNLADGKTTVFALEQLEYFLPGMFVHADDALKGNGVTEKDSKNFYSMMSLRARHSVTRQGRDAGVWNGGAGGFSQSYYPRGSSVTTVEILPNAESFASDLARYAVVSLDTSKCVDEKLLTFLQELQSAASMNAITASYAQWLLPRMEDFLITIQGREDAYRGLGVHARIPTTYAKIETGVDAWLQYGVFIGAITEPDAITLLGACRIELQFLATAQNRLMGIDEKHQRANDAVELFYTLFRQLHRAGKLYATDATFRKVSTWDSNNKVTDTTIRPQPPLFLASEDENAGPCELPDVWGWKFNENLKVYEPHAGGVETGVLKYELGTPVSLHIYVKDFREIIYPAIQKHGIAQSIPLPGLSEMIEKLKKSGKLQSTKNQTHLHGRNSQKGICYILDMSTEPDTEQIAGEMDTLVIDED